MRRLGKGLIIVGLLVGVGWFWAPPVQDAFAADEVRVGASVSLSGKLTREGHGLKEGYEFWADFMNEKGGIDIGNKKYKVKLIAYDDESNPQRAAKLTEKLITEDKVNFLLG